ncbi:hypothetical protein WICMUC_003468 [Wickerhamomyces mucosus]|uniref:Uncharacterized protein n=1 Tax=Wickerhamomyces mucosus TaxID=1378264 RepID=A0A9P8TDF0_9ASCO|nr:hypothetical protein WICMUC_003468 [Wickerhamomyces mucosus]
MDDIWFSIIGLERFSRELNDFLRAKSVDLEAAEKKIYGSTTYYNLYQSGISICFVNLKLDSIDFYQIDKKFKSVDESLLPLEVKHTTTGKTLVEKFGEPLEKGGGFNDKMDIWLRWERIQAEINDRSWETAHNSIWKSITIF